MTAPLPWARERLRDDPLTRGSAQLMVNNLLATGLGFFGWMVTTRLFPPEHVGVAAATISAASLAASVAMLGAPGTILRFLPGHPDGRAVLATAVTVTGAAALLVGSGVAAAQSRGELAGPPLLAFLLFVGLVLGLVLKGVVEAAVTAARSAGTVVVATASGSGAKIGATAVSGLLAAGPLGIVGAQVAAALTSLMVLAHRSRALGLLGGPRSLSVDVLRSLRGYSGTHYVNGLIGGIPALALPIVVNAQLGPESAAYWYVASLMAMALFQIPAAVGMSLLIEGSYHRRDLARLVLRASRGLAAIMLPAIAASALLAPWVLTLFGQSYAAESVTAFRILALSGVLVAATYVLGNVLFIRRRLGPLLLINTANAALVVGLAWQATTLTDVAWAWFAGEVVNVALLLVAIPFAHERAAPA